MRNPLFSIILLFLLACGAHAQKPVLSNTLKEDYYREMASRKNVDPEVRIVWYDSLLNLTKGDKTGIELKKITLLRAGGYTDKALSLSESILSNEKDLKPGEHLAAVFIHANCLNDKRDFLRAIAEYHRVLEMPKPDSLKAWDVKAAFGLLGIYGDLGDNAKSEAWLQKAQTMISTYPLTNEFRGDAEGRIHGSRATLLIASNKLDSAYKEVKIAREMATDEDSRMMTLVQTAQIYILKGQTEAAREYLERALQNKLSGQGKRTGIYMLAQTYLMERRYREALDVLTSYPDETIKVNSMGNQRAYYILRGQAYAGLGEMDAAFNSLDSAIVTGDTIISRMIIHQTRNAEEYMQMRNENIEMGNSLKWQKRLNIALVAFLIITSIATIILLLNNMKLRKRLAMQRAVVNRAKIDSHNISLATTESREKEDTLNRRQTTLLLRLTHLESVLDSMKKKLTADEFDKASRDALLRQIQEINGKEKMWELFSMQFEITNRKFLDLLSERHPNLTKSEKRICAFMLINLSTKEIATLLDRSPRTVDVTKYNIRKKLDIEIPTEEYLRQLAEEASRVGMADGSPCVQ